MHRGGFDEDAIVKVLEDLLKVRIEPDQDWDSA